jgi:peptidoglycan/xylan/chitin deacetylase (PgdA/CDA1 family)
VTKRFQKLVKRAWADIAFARRVDVRLEVPLVSFTFDDAPASAFVQGGGILSDHGYAGTFYVALSLMNSPEVDKNFTQEHLETALRRGHELGCHTYGHIDLSDTDGTDARRDIEMNGIRMQSRIPGFRFNNFSYPFGAQSAGIKRFISTKYRSARGISAGVNGTGTDLYNLKAVKLYEHKYPLSYIFKQMDAAEAQGGWLILYTHDVDKNPTPYGCSPAYFEAVARECARRNTAVRSVDAALNQIGSVI